MARFPTGKRLLAAWAGLCPGNPRVSRQRRSGRRRKPNAHLCSILVETAFAASRTAAGSGLATTGCTAASAAGPTRARPARPPSRSRTPSKVIWSVLASGQPSTDLGADFSTHRVDPQARTRKLIAQLEALSGKRIVFCGPADDPGGQPHAA